ncbi:hypothetical protein D3C81_2151230 [compost metagenome]
MPICRVANPCVASGSSHASTPGNIPNRLLNLLALVALQQIIKLLRRPQHESHALVDVGQVGNGVVAKTNSAPVIDGAALASQRQFNGLGSTGGQVSDV